MHFTAKISIKPFPGLSSKTFPVLFFVFFFGIQKPSAQVVEDFSDGELFSNPSWSGSTGSFIVNDVYQLQLNAAVAGTSWLSTAFPSPQLDEASWEIFVKQSFAPSAANFGRFYLVSDQEDLTSSLNGYYLQFGEAGSNDAVELFRQAGANNISICRAALAGISAAFAIRVRVTRDNQGFWNLSIDYNGGGNFVAEASGIDPTEIVCRYSGILCTYTITNAARFYFDEIAIRSAKSADTTPPQVMSVKVTSGTSLEIIYSEDVQASTAEDPLNYFVSPVAGNPSSARLGDDLKTAELVFSQQFKNGETSSILVKGIADVSGNIIDDTDKPFLFFEQNPVNYRDIIITEFCADPSPPLGLPEAEFVEVYNRGEHPVDLEGWQLSDESTSGQAGSFILLPGKYLILAGPSNIGKFSAAGQTLAVSPFPSLNNSGDLLTLKNGDGKAIDSLRYHISWYRDSEKADGGWSLELIDIQNICAERSNWADAEAPSGGTPGQRNSIYANKPDNTPPGISSLALLNSSTLLIQFDEKLDSTIPSAERFQINPPMEISSVSFGDESFSSIVLVFSQPVDSSQTYSVHISDVYDCPGNKIADGSSAEFVLPDQAVPSDILVNEILFNPRSTGVDFVEIYNRSNKTFDLKNWTLRNFNAGPRNAFIITKQNLLLHPGQYKVFTEDANVLKGEYLAGEEHAFYETDVPPFNDDEGSLTILDENGQIIDSMAYNEQIHTAFLKDKQGVSLERISFNETRVLLSNWRSASSTSGFATPGFVNSNARQNIRLTDEAITVEPEVIHPTAPMRDFARIHYSFDKGGFMANVKIFDHEGRKIRGIAENELLGTQGFFRWDGDHDNGTVARTGYYLVWFQIFDDQGNVRTYRKRVALY